MQITEAKGAGASRSSLGDRRDRQLMKLGPQYQLPADFCNWIKTIIRIIQGPALVLLSMCLFNFLSNWLSNKLETAAIFFFFDSVAPLPPCDIILGTNTNNRSLCSNYFIDLWKFLNSVRNMHIQGEKKNHFYTPVKERSRNCRGWHCGAQMGPSLQRKIWE